MALSPTTGMGPSDAINLPENLIAAASVHRAGPGAGLAPRLFVGLEGRMIF
jgi:hypothetical protein